MAVVSVEGVKSRLAGLDSWLAAAATCEARYNDERIAADIPARIRQFERETQFRVNQVQVCTERDSSYASSGAVFEGRYPFYWEGLTREWLLMTLRCRPVQRIQRLQLYLGEQLMMVLPTQWLRFDGRTGRVWVIPVTGSPTTAAVLTHLALFMPQWRALPDCVAIDYVAGLADGWESDPVLSVEWADLRVALENYCALQVLKDLAELYDAGLLSKSIGADGVSQGVQYSRFQQRIVQLENDLQVYKETLAHQEVPVSLVTV